MMWDPIYLLNVVLTFFVGVFGIATASRVYYLTKFSRYHELDVADYILISCGLLAFAFAFSYLLALTLAAFF